MAGSFELTEEQAARFNSVMAGESVELDDDEAALFNQVMSDSGGAAPTTTTPVDPDMAPTRDQREKERKAAVDAAFKTQPQHDVAPSVTGFSTEQVTAAREASKEVDFAWLPERSEVAPSVPFISTDDIVRETTAQRRETDIDFISKALEDVKLLGGEKDAAKVYALSKRFGIEGQDVAAALPQFEAAAEKAGGSARDFVDNNPALVDYLRRNPASAPVLLTSKSIGPVLQKINAATDWVKDQYEAFLGATIDEERATWEREWFKNNIPEIPIAHGLLKGLADSSLPSTPEELAATDAARVKRDEVKTVEEIDSRAARELRANDTPIGALLKTVRRYDEGRDAMEVSRKHGNLAMAEVKEELGAGNHDEVLRIRQDIHDSNLRNRPLALGDNDSIGADVSAAASGIASTVEVVKGSLRGASTGAAGAAIGGAVVGAVATRTPAGALEGSVFAVRTLVGPSAKVGAAWATFQMEFGDSYQQQREMETDLGRKLSPSEAAGYAVIAAAAKTGLEMISLGAEAKVAKTAMESTLNALVKKNPLFRQALAKVAKEYASSVATEGFTEGLQAAVDDALVYVSAAGKDSFEPTTFVEQKRQFVSGQNVLGSAEAGSAAAAVMGAPSVVISVGVHAAKRDRGQVSNRQVKPILAVHGDESVLLAPEPHAEAMTDASSKDAMPAATALHVDPEAVAIYFQKKGLTPEQAHEELEKAAGPGASERLAEAISTGSKLEILLPTVLSNWNGSDMANALVDDVTVDSGSATENQKKAAGPELETEATRIADAEIERQEQEQVLNNHVGDIERQLIAAGQPADSAKANAFIWRVWMESRAKDLGVTVGEAFPEAPVAFDKGGNYVPSMTPEQMVLAHAKAVSDAPEGQQRVTYTDEMSGMYNRKGFDMQQEPDAPGVVVAMTSTDSKPINDATSHPHTDMLFRVIGEMVSKHDPNAGRQGTVFYFRAESVEQAQKLANEWKAKLPANMRMSVGTGKNSIAASENLEDIIDAGRSLGRIEEGIEAEANDAELMAEYPNAEKLPGKRTGTAVDLNKVRGPDAFGKDPGFIERPVTEAMSSEAKKDYSDHKQFADKQYRDQLSGGKIYNKRGFEAVGEKAHVVAFDGIGIKGLNDKYAEVARRKLKMSRQDARDFGKRMGDKALIAIAQAANRIGGSAVAFARLSGDEFAAKHDSKQALLQFTADLVAELNSAQLDFKILNDSFVITPEVRWGIGEKTYEAADLNLGKRKLATAEAKKSGRPDRSLADLPRATLQNQRARRALARGVREATGGTPGQGNRSATVLKQEKSPNEQIKGRVEPMLREAILTTGLADRAEFSASGDAAYVTLLTGSKREMVPLVDVVSRLGLPADAVKDIEKYTAAMVAEEKVAEQQERYDEARRRAIDEGLIEEGEMPDKAYGIARPQAAQQQSPGDLRLFQEGENADANGFTVISPSRGQQSTIKAFLNKDANVFTVAHESAHVFLEQMFDLAERADADERTKGIAASILAAFGLKSRTEITEKEHEEWARSFEQYVAEGKAPSKKLTKAFARFASWLVNFYKSIRNIPGTNLSPELRSVFDAMLATDREIDRALDEQGGVNTVGLTPEQRAARIQEVKDDYREATHALQYRAIRDALRSREKWWKTALAKVTKSFEQEYDMLPARQAQIIASGETTGERIVLDRKAVQKVIGDSKVVGLHTAEDGESPRVLAELAGFSSPEAMLAAMAGLPSRETWAAEQADIEMKRQWPGILEDIGNFRALLRDGLRAATVKRLEAEIRGLPREALARAAKKIAATALAGRLSPVAALKRMRTASEQKAKAMAKGDIAATADAATRELLNHYLFGELSDAQKKVNKLVDTTQRLRRSENVAKLGRGSENYQRAVGFLLSAFGMGPDSDATAADLAAAIETLRDGYVIDVIESPDWLSVIESAISRGVTDYRKMRMDEVEALADALSMIETDARNRSTIILDGQRVDLETTEAQILDETKDILPSKPYVEENQRTTGEAIVAKARGFDAWLTAIPDWVRDLAGANVTSVLHRTVVAVLRRAQIRESDLMKEAFGPALKTLRAISAEQRKRWSEKIDGKALFPGHIEKLEAPRTIESLVVMALNYGSESSREKMLEGRGITHEQVVAALEQHLTADDVTFVNSMIADIGALRDESFEVEFRVSGVRPEAVKAVPLTLSIGTLKGGYFPLKAVPAVSSVGAKQFGEDAAAQFMDPTFTRPSTTHGHLKKRTGAVYPVSLDLAVIARHLVQTIHDITHREAVLSTGKLLTRPALRDLFVAKLSPEKYTEAVQQLKDIGQARGLNSSPADGIIGFVKGNVTTSALSRLGSALNNLANPVAAVISTKLKALPLAAAFVEFAQHPLRQYRIARQRSGVLRSMESESLEELRSELNAVSKGKWRTHYRTVRNVGLWFMKTLDSMQSTAIWHAAANQAEDEGRSPEEAARFADDILLQVQPSNSALERSRSLRDSKGMASLFINFYGYLNVAYRANHRLAQPLFTKEFAEASPARKAQIAAMTAGSLAAFSMAMGPLSELLGGRGASDEDRDKEDPDNEALKWRNWLVRKMALAPLSTLPFTQIVSAFEATALGKTISPRADPLSASVQEFLKGMSKADKEEDLAMKAAIALRTAAQALGFPTGLISSSGDAVWNFSQGKADPEDTALETAGDFTYGVKRSNDDNVFTLIQTILDAWDEW